jgi:hypothetical protein
MAHRCHASGCRVSVPPKMFMCRRHWFMVPVSDRALIWSLYRPGQEQSKDPSIEYVVEAQRVIDELALRENVPPTLPLG